MMKKISKIALTIGALSLFVPKVNAFPISIDIPNTKDAIISNNTGGSGDSPFPYYVGDELKCEYGIVNNPNREVIINALDINNEQLIWNSSIPINDIIAGTYLKMNIYERRLYSWEYHISKYFIKPVIETTYEYETEKYTCQIETNTLNGGTSFAWKATSTQTTWLPEASSKDNLFYKVTTPKAHFSNNTFTDDIKTVYQENELPICDKTTMNKGITYVKYVKTDSTKEQEVEKKIVIDFNDSEHRKLYEKCQEAAARSLATSMSNTNEPLFDIYLPNSNSIEKDSISDARYISAADSQKNVECTGSEITKLDSEGNPTCKVDHELILTKATSGDGTYRGEPTYKYSGKGYNQYYYYSASGACVNTKTAEVTYLSKTKLSCDKDEIKIDPIEYKDDDGVHTYWPYFIPLDAKTGDKITVRYSSTKGENVLLNEAECQYVIRHNPVFFVKDPEGIYKLTKKDQYNYNSYEDFLAPENTTFNCTSPNDCYSYCIVEKTSDIPVTKSRISDRSRLESAKLNLPDGVKCYGVYNSDKYNEMYDSSSNREYYGKCKLQVLVSFPITQKFYNEETTTTNVGTNITKFKGFKFYYRPIDINNPFPNTNYSIQTSNFENSTKLWYGYNESNNSYKTLDNNIIYFSDSFKNITYSTKNITKIRNAFSEPYTSWSNISSDGTNIYINKNETIIREDNSPGYKIGCGPANSIKNYFDSEGNSITNQLYLPYCGGEVS